MVFLVQSQHWRRVSILEVLTFALVSIESPRCDEKTDLRFLSIMIVKTGCSCWVGVSKGFLESRLGMSVR